MKADIVTKRDYSAILATEVRKGDFDLILVKKADLPLGKIGLLSPHNHSYPSLIRLAVCLVFD